MLMVAQRLLAWTLPNLYPYLKRGFMPFFLGEFHESLLISIVFIIEA